MRPERPDGKVSTVGVFAFLLSRTFANAVRRRLSRLREPRYLAGAALAALYFYFYVFRMLIRGPGGTGRGAAFGPLPSEAWGSLLLLAASFVLAEITAGAWLFGKGTPKLHLSEADVQFLLPAPLPPRAVVHFSLLRSQLSLVFSALIMGLVFGRGLSSHGWQRAASFWIVLAALHLHTLARAFSKATWEEMPRRRALWLRLGVGAASILLAAVLAVWLIGSARQLLPRLAEGDGISSAEIAPVVARWSHGWVPSVLLAPWRALLAPALAPDAGSFWRSLPAALGILALHYVWVVAVSRRYEEAALEGARRRAATAARRRRGRLGGLPRGARREAVPFPLGARGLPELAVVWKNLLSRGRFRLRSALLGIGITWVLLGVGAALAVGRHPEVAEIVQMIATSLGFLAVPLALMMPLALRYDFRADLEHAAILRGWPLAPSRLAVAELLAPLLVAVLWIWGCLGGLAALMVGTSAAHSWGGLAGVLEAPRSDVAVAAGLPAALAVALFLPALVAAVLVLQNLAVLAFPAWFPPGLDRKRGFEATGTRLLSFLGTLLIVLLALVPAALCGGLVAWLGWRPLGAWALVPAALAAAVPVWGEVAAAVPLLGRLFVAFDVSRETLD